MFLLQALMPLLVPLVFLDWTLAQSNKDNTFVYHSFNRKSDSRIHLPRQKLLVDSSQAVVLAREGDNVSLPCRFWYQPQLESTREVRIKWSWLPAAGARLQEDVLVSAGPRSRSSGAFRGRVRLLLDAAGDASLFIADVQKTDMGRFVCEVVDGLEDRSATVDLELRGVVFPYQHPKGRYFLNFTAAQQACENQNSTVATLSQLLRSWEEGLNWCNAGWLADRTVKYPVTQPRGPCGGQDLGPGIRSYGRRQRHRHHFDVFCFTSSLTGKVYYLQPGHKMNLLQARQACRLDRAEVASVGQMFAAWKFQGLDHCAAGWLSDGSVRYAMTSPRRNCGASEPGVRSLGFPPPHHQHGVYCYQEDQL